MLGEVLKSTHRLQSCGRADEKFSGIDSERTKPCILSISVSASIFSATSKPKMFSLFDRDDDQKSVALGEQIKKLRDEYGVGEQKRSHIVKSTIEEAVEQALRRFEEHPLNSHLR